MTFQLVAVYVQNMKLRKRVILRELFFVVLYIKPGIDAYRVATKQPQIPGTKFTPHTEMVFVRGAELVTECIPGTIIKALAFISGEQSLIAAVSLISGILTSAFISASISIEKDISKAPRYETPDFYGIVPLESWWRTITTCLLILLMATVQLAAKAFAFAICNVESSSILAAYLVIDYSVALTFKLVRGDLTYWISIESISIKIAVALLLRIGMKAIMDFTGMLQARHPSEYGGGYFSLTLLTTPIVGMYFGSRYLNYVEDEQVRESLSHVFTSTQVYGLLGGLSALQIFSFCLLLRIIPAKFRTTFLGFQTAPQFYSKRFHAFTEDSKRVAVFTCQKEMYLPVLDDVKKWLNERLPEWIAEEPEWFDDRIKRPQYRASWWRTRS
ncbi:hypothetical protein TrLO_g1593 [Triparma laevis f. longispina]|uniref:Uncharacterized protein n=1 Tax=Triparma laevis f. longispina TaxID=1714387 RepID=A0A9W7C696_9STRA|nr:hypothetical protein TrLO_g1593 [Triparma laevis f. longispina]